MKMIRAILRPEVVDGVAENLSDAGFFSLTKIHVFGRGKQNGIVIGATHYDELPKIMLMIVIEDDDVDKVMKIIKYKSYTGNYGDGKIFISAVDNACTVRTGAMEL